MKYLDKTFTIYPPVRTKKYSPLRAGKVRQIDPSHPYQNLSGMCGVCALSREGHRSKYGR